MATVAEYNSMSLRYNCLWMKYVDRSVSAMVSGSTTMSWKYDDEQCVCGEVESEKHDVLLDCNLYMDARERRK